MCGFRRTAKIYTHMQNTQYNLHDRFSFFIEMSAG